MGKWGILEEAEEAVDGGDFFESEKKIK